MADSAVIITEGSGVPIDTRTEAGNGNHRQVVVLGDPSVNAGVAPVDATSGLKVNLGADNDVTVTSGTVSLSAGTNTIGSVTVSTATTGGASIFRSLDLDETEEEVKATAGTLYGGIVMNLSTSILYLKFYNATAANVTVGTTTPVLTIPIPLANSGDASGFILPIPAQGVAFSTAICVAATTGLADNSTGAPGTNEVVVNLFYA